MNPRDEIRMDAAGVPQGFTCRYRCPFCKASEWSLNITRTYDGAVYMCHRASCGAKGFVASGAQEARAPREKPPSLYEGELLALRAEDEKFFLERYEVHPGGAIARTEYDEYVLPIYSPDGYTSGYNVRQPWPGAPCKGRADRPKSKVYAESSRPVQSFYDGTPRGDNRTVLLVEDQLSAMKAAEHAEVLWAVALMGAHLDIPRVQEIARLKPSQVLLALDKDATETAFKLAREYGLAFPKLRVVILDKDIKDTPASDINEVLGL